MGAWLKSRELKPDLMVSSAAKRAINTAQMIAEAVGYPGKAILIQDRMYLAEVSTLVDVIHALDDQHQRVYLIGHNPGCTELVHHLANETLGNLPTAGVASIQFPVDSWTHIMPGCGKLVFLEYPKK
jgi:phosphohistidine phosphatase